MKAAEIRQSFFDFFKSKGHTIVPGASLVPNNDPTLLFTNAGMNQFKDVFLGLGKREYTRAADTQKCMRVSGKHNDLEDVGKDTYHHTLFEMLGNWSFGDYYKKEAIEWAWELLTKVWKLPKDKLYATVFRTDDESFELWKKVSDIDPTHILRFDEKDNFWEMGETGPCGPCSEIHIDLGPKACDKQGEKGHTCGVNGNCSRYIELWNLVFVQYNRLEDRSLENLPATHVDTGMGFERITAVLQGKTSNYDTDIFTPILDRISELSGGKPYEGANQIPMRVIADHIRALSFALADGVMPSNEGRGYVIRKILRRAIRYGKFLGFEAPFLHKIVDTLVREMGDFFPELRDRAEMVKGLILSEEESFFKTLYRGLDKLNEIIVETKKADKKEISGENVFYLYDSLGLPLDFTQHTAEDEGLSIDIAKFQTLMEQQKERARAHFKSGAFDFSVISGKAETTLYRGEEEFSSKSTVQLIVANGQIQTELTSPAEAVVILDQTPFYGEKGGQVGDTGILENGDFRFEVNNTRIYEDTTLHYGKLIKGRIKVGMQMTATVDKERKLAIARHHTATHLLHKALRTVVGEHAEQAGSLVSPDYLRFDFTHGQALSRQEIEEIEEIVNSVVLKNLPIHISLMSKEEAVKSGAVAIFEEKYGEVVRVVEVEGFSKELCGGTHVSRSGDIGLIKILSESSVSAGTRRLEALTGIPALKFAQEQFAELKSLSALLKTDESSLLEKTEQILQNLKEKEKEIKKLKAQTAISGLNDWISAAEKFQNSLVVIRQTEMDSKTMMTAVDEFKKKVSSGILFLISGENKKVHLTVSVSKDLTSKIKAGDLARECAKVVGGGGGGRPDLAQAGGKNPDAIPKALQKAKEIIQKALN